MSTVKLNELINFDVIFYYFQLFTVIHTYLIPTVYFFRPYIAARFIRLSCSNYPHALRIEFFGCDFGMGYDMGWYLEF